MHQRALHEAAPEVKTNGVAIIADKISGKGLELDRKPKRGNQRSRGNKQRPDHKFEEINPER